MKVGMLSVSGAGLWSIPTMEHRSMININSGTFNQLKTLVGIGDTYAKRIVEGRPYQRTGELVTKQVIPQMTYDMIKDHIITRPH
ncbi:MAG: ComEA family DNA-binding protein [Nitrospira sp.]